MYELTIKFATKEELAAWLTVDKKLTEPSSNEVSQANVEVEEETKLAEPVKKKVAKKVAKKPELQAPAPSPFPQAAPVAVAPAPAFSAPAPSPVQSSPVVDQLIAQVTNCIEKLKQALKGAGFADKDAEQTTADEIVAIQKHLGSENIRISKMEEAKLTQFVGIFSGRVDQLVAHYQSTGPAPSYV